MEPQQAKQQVTDLLKKGSKFLILSSQSNSGSLGPILALKKVLSKLGKETTAFVINQIPQKYSFLPQKEQIKTDLSNLKTFVISVDCQNVKVDKLGYNLENNKLKIHITPKQGNITKECVSFEESKQAFDAIIAINTKKPDDLGRFYEENSDLFFNVPLINIDYRNGNNYYGKINLIDLKAVSAAEITLSLIESLSTEKPLIDEEIATLLLSALIEDTNSFQSTTTTPKSFSVAAQLVGAGAKKQDIINNLFEQKSISNLRFWGRVLAGIREDSENNILWTVLTERNLEQTGANQTDVESIIPEFFNSTKNAEVSFILFEKQGQLIVELQTNGKTKASDIATLFGFNGSEKRASFNIISTGIATAEKELLDKIKSLKNQSSNQELQKNPVGKS